MKRILSTIVVLFVFVYAPAQGTSGYHRVKVNTGFEGLKKMAAKGIVVDHGTIKKGISFSSDLSEEEIALLDELGLSYEIEIYDVGNYYRERSKREMAAKEYTNGGCISCPEYASPENFELGSMAGFYTLQEMKAVLDSMHARFPNLITAKQPIGTYTTNDGEQVYYVKMSDNPDDEEAGEQEVLYTALHHAREVQSLSQLIYYMWYLLEHYGSDPEITQLLDSRALYFVPCLNPDGYLYNEATYPDGGGMWRKNRRNNGGSYGVDLNRNYGSHWGYDDFGSSPSGSSDVYRGPEAFSENETKAMRDFCNEHDFVLALNAHTFSNLLIYPYGYVPSLESPDSVTFRTVADEMTACSGFIAGTGNETVGYVTNGDSDDWMYAEQTSKEKIYALTPEAGSGDDGFWPLSSRIIPIARNTLQQNLFAARLAGPYCEIKPEPQPSIESLSSYIRFTFKRTGVEEGGTYTVSLVPLSEAIVATGAAKTYSSPAINSPVADSISINLAPTTALNTNIRFAIKWSHSSGFTLSDTFTFKYTNLDTVYYSGCDDLAGFSGDWGVSTTSYVSPTGSFTDSPLGNYPSNAELTLNMEEWIDLENASAAMLTYDAKWDIEKGYDYVEVLAEIEGGGRTSLCGAYTRAGNDNQDNAAAIYDGTQESWVKEQIDLSAFSGQKIKLIFSLHSDPALEYDGFYMDDLTILANDDSAATSLSNQAVAANEVLCFPNPANGWVQLRYRLAAGTGKAMFSVCDLSGRTVWEQALNTAQMQAGFPTSSFAPGIYLYRISTDKGNSIPQKIVISR